MKLNTVLTIVIFSLHGFALAYNNVPAPGNSLPNAFQPASRLGPLAKGGHGPETPPERTTKIESIHPTETKSADLPKKSETSPLPKTKTPDLPKKSKTPDLPKTKTLDLPERSETPNTPKTKTLDSPKSETPHTPKAAEPTGQEDAHPTKSTHTTESKKSDPAKSPSPHPKVSEKPKPSGFTTHRRTTTSSTSHAAVHSSSSELAGGMICKLPSIPFCCTPTEKLSGYTCTEELGDGQSCSGGVGVCCLGEGGEFSIENCEGSQKVSAPVVWKKTV